MERHLDRLLVQRAVKRLVEVVGALVERPAIIVAQSRLSEGSCAAPPDMANSSETTGTAWDGTSQNFNPRGLVTHVDIDGGMRG